MKRRGRRKTGQLALPRGAWVCGGRGLVLFLLHTSLRELALLQVWMEGD